MLDEAAVIGFVLSVLLYATVMLAAGLCAAWLLRRRPARAHAAIVLSLVAAVLTPAAAELARRADVGLLPARSMVVQMPVMPPMPPPRLEGLGLSEEDKAAFMAEWDRPKDPRVVAIQNEMFRDGLQRGLEASPDVVGAFSRIADQPWIWFGALVWGLLSALVVARTLAAAVSARWLIGRATDTAPGFIRAAVERAAADAGVRRACVRVSAHVASPVVWCWGMRPVIVVPAQVEGDVDWASVMRHELAHWARRDHLADLLARGVIALVPFHPLAWAARGYLERLAERACDDWAVSRGENTAYAQSLVTLASRMRGPRLALPVARKGSDLAARVRRVLNRGSVFPGIGRGWLVAGVATASCATALVALARHPVGEVKLVDPAIESKPENAEQPEKKAAAAPKPGEQKPETAGLPLDQAVKMLYDSLATEANGRTFTLASEIAERKDPRAIPLLIGVIDSDNTYWSVYGVGYFGLAQLTGVKYDDRYDGTWWKAWWEKNKDKYPAEARATPVPAFAPTKNRVAQVYDFGEWVGLTSGEPPERILKEIERRLTTDPHGGGLGVSDLSARLVKEHGARAIPWLIGVIDSDNTYSTIYGVGYFGLTPITGVKYDERRDGAWWRAWWEKNKAKFPLDAQQIEIPTFTKSPRYVASVYDHGQWIGEVDTEPVSRMLAELKRRVDAGGQKGSVSGLAQIIDERGDPSAIPEMIAMIQSDASGKAKYDIGYFGLRGLTQVRWDESHDGAWWGKWWEQNKGRFPASAKPDPVKPPGGELPKPGGGAAPPAPELADVADVSNEDISIGGDAKKRYFLIGAAAADDKTAATPRALLVVLPGGDGSADFNPFIRRMWKNALPWGVVVAQAVAPKWREGDERIVWPTEKLPDEKMAFSTEKFVEEIVADAKTRVKIDPERVYVLGWSSGGPPAYTLVMREGSGFKGAFVAMSVYKPETLPPAAKLEGKSVYVFHSPQDFIKMNFPRAAVEQLGAAGARVKLQEYEGGHGWKGNIWKNIRTGVEWMMGEQARGPAGAAPRP